MAIPVSRNRRIVMAPIAMSTRADGILTLSGRDSDRTQQREDLQDSVTLIVHRHSPFHPSPYITHDCLYVGGKNFTTMV